MKISKEERKSRSGSKIYVGKSNLEGEGLFATRDIKKGEIIFKIKGKKVKFLIIDEKKADSADMNWFGYGKNTWTDSNNYGVYFNHSCKPNSSIKGKVTFIANKNIKKGEEVTFDYSASEADIFFKFDCNCGNKECRKVVKSIQFLPRKIFNSYMPYIPKFFQMVYKKYNINNFKNEEELKKSWVSYVKKDFRV